MIERILAGEQLCPGEIPHHNGTQIVEHVQAHIDGRCRKGEVASPSTKGHYHPMSCPDVDLPYGERLLAEADAACTCGEHKEATNG